MSKILNAAQFDACLSAGELKLTLVGMSGVGKSRLSQSLAMERGFNRICCDDLIEARLKDVLARLGYGGGIGDVSKWLGQPYDERFIENQQTYLNLETATMQDIIGQLRANRTSGNTVIDTTGSIVHTDPKIRRALGELTTVVYIEATSDMKDTMLQLYLKEPKPVVWGNMYGKQAGESPEQTLACCYPNLLAYRSELYAAMAQVITPRPLLEGTDANQFLKHIRDALPTAI